MRARKSPCPDCGGKIKRTSQKWRCTNCWARGTFLNDKPVVISRYMTFSANRGWRLNPHHPLASMMTKLRAVSK